MKGVLAAGGGWDGIAGGRGSTEGGEERDVKHRTATAKLRPARADERRRLGTK